MHEYAVFGRTAGRPQAPRRYRPARGMSTRPKAQEYRERSDRDKQRKGEQGPNSFRHRRSTSQFSGASTKLRGVYVPTRSASTAVWLRDARAHIPKRPPTKKFPGSASDRDDDVRSTSTRCRPRPPGTAGRGANALRPPAASISFHERTAARGMSARAR